MNKIDELHLGRCTSGAQMVARKVVNHGFKFLFSILRLSQTSELFFVANFRYFEKII
jgi:hypothetical protein